MKCDIELANVVFTLEMSTFDEALIDNDILPIGSTLTDTREFSFLLLDREASNLNEAKTLAWNGKEGLMNHIKSSTMNEYAANGIKLVVVRPTSLADWDVILHRSPSNLRNAPGYLQL